DRQIEVCRGFSASKCEGERGFRDAASLVIISGGSERKRGRHALRADGCGVQTVSLVVCAGQSESAAEVCAIPENGGKMARLIQLCECLRIVRRSQPIAHEGKANLCICGQGGGEPLQRCLAVNRDWAGLQRLKVLDSAFAVVGTDFGIGWFGGACNIDWHVNAFSL